MSICTKHNTQKKCLAGHSAHPDNWYCDECDNESDNVCNNCLAILGDWDCCTVESGERFPNGWDIVKNPKPIPDRRFDFDFWHEDHDGDNGLCGTAESKEDAIKQIKAIELSNCINTL